MTSSAKRGIVDVSGGEEPFPRPHVFYFYTVVASLSDECDAEGQPIPNLQAPTRSTGWLPTQLSLASFAPPCRSSSART